MSFLNDLSRLFRKEWPSIIKKKFINFILMEFSTKPLLSKRSLKEAACQLLKMFCRVITPLFLFMVKQVQEKHLQWEQGLIPLSLNYMLNHFTQNKNKEEWSISISFMQIYMEDIYDLFNPTNGKLQIRESLEQS